MLKHSGGFDVVAVFASTRLVVIQPQNHITSDAAHLSRTAERGGA